MSDCERCGGILTGRQKKYDSAECRKMAGRAAWIMKVYGITLEQYDEILAIQDGKCAICGKRPTTGKHLSVDHEHGGGVRGLLCHYCNNRLVGRLKNHEMAQKLADYLRDPPARMVVGDAVAPGRPRKKRGPRKRQQN